MRWLPRLALCAALTGAAAAQGALPPIGPTRLSFDEACELAREPRWLSLACAEFDTRENEPTLPDDLRSSSLQAAGPTYFLAQFDGPLTSAARRRIARTGAQLLDYVPNHAYIVRADAMQRAALERLVETVWSSELHPAYRLDPRLRWASLEPLLAVAPLELVAVGFAGGERAELESAAQAQGAQVVETYSEFGRWFVRLRASAARARALARERSVQWIEPASAPELRNNNVAWVVQTNQNGNTRLWSLGLHGEGQVLGHIDGPFTSTPCWFRDPLNTPIGPMHRKIVYSNASGADTHGTHTACTAAGDAAPITGSTSGRGLAYMAKLAHTDFPVTSFAGAAATHSSHGARVHTNSWGDDTTTAYNALAQSVDAYQWANEDELVLFSISNGAFITNPDNAKNHVAVGATQNGIAAGGQCFGGTGPTADGRRKPDLMTPGCNVVSAATGACATTTLNGTSMATPSAAAAAALVRQYFESGFHPRGVATPSDARVPSGALIKAVLVNSAQDVTGIAGYPSDFEGWGRINLDQALYFVGDASKLFVAEARRANGLSTGDTASYTLHVQSSAPFAITLAFTDAPGTLNASNPVVNDLDLELVSPSNVVYRGNVFAAGVSISGGAADPKNNLERCVFAAPEVGAWSVHVHATNVAQGPQGFALCANGDLAFGGTSSPVSYCSTPMTTNLCSPTMTTAGVARAGAAAGFTVSASNVEGQRQGVVFYGVTGRVALAWHPGNSSVQCVRQPLQRTAAQNSGGTLGGCDGLLSIDWNAFVANRPGALGTPIVPGLVVDAQAWFRDPLAPGQGNLSNAIEFIVQP
ncbi:MAG: S8 family serine peptidase [Planctomycetes bacterium]|nr:S8 family serine peptidase [Planctomycetota bacterium]